MRHALLPPLFGLVMATPGAAQEPLVEVDPVIVTVSPVPFPLSVAPASVTLIDRHVLEASRAATLEDVLRAAPFVDLSRAGGRGGLTAVTLRGGDPNFTLVLIDGVPVNDPTNLLGGSFDFSTLSVDNVERVEIVRGPLSSRYGSEAMAGVIHIISRRGRGDPGWGAEAAAGSFGAREGRLWASGSRGILAASGSASWVRVDEQVESDPYRLATVSLSSDLAGRLGEVRITSRVHHLDSDGFPDNGGGPRFSILRDPRRTVARESVLGLEARRGIREGWNLMANADAYRREAEVRTPPILDADPPGPFALPAVDQESALNRRRLSLTSAWEVAAGLSILMSGELRHEDGESDALIAGELPADFALDRTTRSAAGEIVYRSDRLSIDLALRVDDPDGFAGEVSPRAAVAWRPPWNGSRIGASWGEGFKLPSFFALGEPNVGNPDLGPERSRGFDIGWTQEIPVADLVLSVTAFRQRYRDLIDFSPEEFRLVNRRLARTRGVEAEAEWHPHRHLAFTGFARWLDAELVGTGEELRDRPRWRGGATAQWSSGTTQARLEVVSVDERFDFQIPVPERNVADGYTAVSLALSQRFDRFTAFARIDNLMDADYEEFVGFPAPGRGLRLGIRYDD
ncbi:MAG TPA: TonB-dependent receptor [Gemmatimonadota bacterium]|nr:TonB-dependent receptor [Gemmatimonadota bacterium]